MSLSLTEHRVCGPQGFNGQHHFVAVDALSLSCPKHITRWELMLLPVNGEIEMEIEPGFIKCDNEQSAQVSNIL
jgi:hypothetical protein